MPSFNIFTQETMSIYCVPAVCLACAILDLIQHLIQSWTPGGLPVNVCYVSAKWVLGLVPGA